MKISRRSVFLIGGYDPKTPAAFFERLATELKRFEQTWNATASVSPVSVSCDGEIGTVEIAAAGADWRVATHFGFLVLDTIVLKDFSQPLYFRLFKYLSAFNDYALSGTYFMMIRKAWRFAGKLTNRDYSTADGVGHFNIDKQPQIPREVLAKIVRYARR